MILPSGRFANAVRKMRQERCVRAARWGEESPYCRIVCLMIVGWMFLFGGSTP